MKHQIEFHCAYTLQPFIINPDTIVTVAVNGEGAYIVTDFDQTLEVKESYKEVKDMLYNFYYYLNQE